LTDNIQRVKIYKRDDNNKHKKDQNAKNHVIDKITRKINVDKKQRKVQKINIKQLRRKTI